MVGRSPLLRATPEDIAWLVRFEPGLSRAEIAARLGLTPSTISPFVTALIDDGVLEEIKRALGAAQRGRPTAGLHVRGVPARFGLILWGHGVLDTSVQTFDGDVVFREVSAVVERPSAAAIAQASRNLAEAAAPHHLDLVVLGLPAPYRRGVGLPRADESAELPPGVVPTEHFAHWFDGDPARLITVTPGTRVIAVNDTNLAGLGEARDGAATGSRCAVTVRMSGSGIGSAITIGGNLFEGAGGFAGEIAHVRVDDDSPEICVCGSRGCLRQKVGPTLLEPLHAALGSDITYTEVVRLAGAGEPGPIRVLEDAGRMVGRALADLATHLNPDVIVVDAGSAHASEIVLHGVTQQIEQSAPPFIRAGLALRTTELGDLAPLRGALHVARAAATSAQRSSRAMPPRR